MNMQAEEDDVTAKSNRWSNNLTKPWAGAEGLLGSGFRLPDRIGTDLNQHQTHLGCTLLAKGENKKWLEVPMIWRAEACRF